MIANLRDQFAIIRVFRGPPPGSRFDHTRLWQSPCRAFDVGFANQDNEHLLRPADLLLLINIVEGILMNHSSRMGSGLPLKAARLLLWVLPITALLLAAACGGSESQPNTQVGLYSPGSKTDEDVDRELKFDARVQNYSAEGDKLVVNVNESFASSPPGIQQRALGHWYSLWQAARTPQNSKPQKDLEVVVRFEGNDLAKWTRDQGFKPVQRAKGKKDEDDDEPDAEAE